MDFVDATILRLADESARATVFDEESLSQLLSASHDVSGTDVEAPFTLALDEISFVHDDEACVAVDGSWITMGQTDRTELALRAAGLAPPPPRIDLLLAGAVVATARGGTGRISGVAVHWLELVGLDDELQPLPTDPAELEQARRERLLARIRARLDQPAAFDGAALVRWLTRLGVDSVAELMEHPPAAGATMRVAFAEGPDAPPRRRQFPLAAALLVRAAPLSLASLLDETRRIRPHLQRMGFGFPEVAPRGRRSPIVAWVVPAALFDDDAWPGATAGSAPEKRAERRRWAGEWLAGERIGLVVPPT